ncbi:MAG: PIG-L family deacetylase [bacterium]|nr:PIG-L family deacetylase [bacterium]
MKTLDSFNNIFENKERILFVMSHPDDAEVMAGGMIARLVAAGKRVRFVKMTMGNKGSRQEVISESDLTQMRKEEDANAIAALGVLPEDNVYLDISDGAIENDIETIGKIAKQIRIFKPDLIVTHNPEDMIIRFAKDENWVNHRDHRNTGKSALDAAYPYSRDLLFFPEQLKEEGVDSHSCGEFLLVDYYNHPDTIMIDVTDFMEKRVTALASHASQYTLDKAQGTSDFLTKNADGRHYEKFRYVTAE